MFYVDGCPYCDRAREFLRSKKKIKYKGYNIANIAIPFDSMLELFKYNNLVANYNTKPLIFWNGQFIGGTEQLLVHYQGE
jgi:glutaredoxin